MLDARKAPRARETATFRDLVSRAFSQRRKTLRNAWKGIASLDSAGLAEAARRADIDLSMRGEVLSIEAFRRMAEEVDDTCA